MLDRKRLDTFYRDLQTPSRNEANTPTHQPLKPKKRRSGRGFQI
jgi:hypothetical protein